MAMSEAFYRYTKTVLAEGLRTRRQGNQMSSFFFSLSLPSPLLLTALAKPNKKPRDKEGKRKGGERGGLYKYLVQVS